MSYQKWLEGLLERGDLRSLSKLISIVENRHDGYEAIVDQIYSRTGNAHRIGITGPPGAGKSTLVDQLVPHFREAGKTVGVIACDPTSPFSGGALLGDRVRMQALLEDDGVFIRSIASRGSLGGLSQTAHEVGLLLEAANYDIVIYETVGVGQAEIDIMQTADTVAVVVIPQSGDAVQAIKAGLMEIADVFVLNKADQGQVDRAVQALHLALPPIEETERWVPPIVKTIAPQGDGLVELKEAIDAHRAHLGAEGLERKQRERLERFIKNIIEHALRKELWNDERLNSLRENVSVILQGDNGPYQLAHEMERGLGL